MTVAQAKALLDKATYKPGSRLVGRIVKLQGDQAYGLEVLLSQVLEDVRRRGRQHELGYIAVLPVALLEHLDAKGVMEWVLRNVVEKMESHEAKEWLRVDGAMVVDPHEDD
jgi:hypothetical protein